MNLRHIAQTLAILGTASFQAQSHMSYDASYSGGNVAARGVTIEGSLTALKRRLEQAYNVQLEGYELVDDPSVEHCAIGVLRVGHLCNAAGEIHPHLPEHVVITQNADTLA